MLVFTLLLSAQALVKSYPTAEDKDILTETQLPEVELPFLEQVEHDLLPRPQRRSPRRRGLFKKIGNAFKKHVVQPAKKHVVDPVAKEVVKPIHNEAKKHVYNKVDSGFKSLHNSAKKHVYSKVNTGFKVFGGHMNTFGKTMGGHFNTFGGHLNTGLGHVGNAYEFVYGNTFGYLQGWLDELFCSSNGYFHNCKDRNNWAPNWMSSVPDATLLTEMTIPGTHDAAARHGGGAPAYVKCQSMSIDDQLRAGIRYLDIRPRDFYNTLPIHHGSVYQKESFSGVLRKVKSFLDSYPTETVIFRIKEEHSAVGSTIKYGDNIKNTMNNILGASRILAASPFVNPTTLTLGDMRGRVAVLQNYAGVLCPGGLGSGSSSWTSSLNVIQDMWEVNTVWDADSKLGKIRGNMDAAGRDNTKLYINHLSGTGAGMGGISKLARKANKMVKNNLGHRGTGLGIIIMDYPGKDLINDLIYRNPGRYGR